MTQNPFAEAFTAIVGGIITGVLLQVVMQKHSVLNAPLIFYASIILIAIFDYVAGIIEAHVFGFLFPITLIFFARAHGKRFSLALLHLWFILLGLYVHVKVLLRTHARTLLKYVHVFRFIMI